MEQKKDILLFKAAYYADLSTLKGIIKKKEDLQIVVPTDESGWTIDRRVQVSVLDILNWASFAYYDGYECENSISEFYDANGELSGTLSLDSASYYRKIMACIEWICSRFSIENDHLKDYSSHLYLRNIADDEWLNEEEIQEATRQGFRQMDLELINEGIKGNGKRCYELVKKGARYQIDPLDFSDRSVLKEVLVSDISWHCTLVSSYLSDRSQNRPGDFYDMLSSLYTTGVSQYIIDIITMNDKKKN